MTEKNHPFEKVFMSDGSPFNARYAAQDWIERHGGSVGPSSIGSPMGIVMQPDVYIAKFRNMTKKEQEELDGTLSHSRGGDAVIRLKNWGGDRD